MATIATTNGSTKRTPSERSRRCPIGADRMTGAGTVGAGTVAGRSGIRHLPLDQVVLGGVGTGDLAHDPPRAHHQDPVGDLTDLLEVRRTDDDRCALPRQVAQALVDLELRG